MLFKDIIGQDELKKALISSVKDNRVSHTQLFLGPLGYGGLPLALAYAQYLNCEQPTDTDACGICPSCLKAQKLVHPDIHFSYPFAKVGKNEIATDLIKEWREALLANPYLSLNDWLGKMDAENKQANIPVKECHDIIHRLNLKSFESKYKVMIIWLPEFLGKEGNTLLKIFEEPPENTIFLLIAEDQDSILNTILSRTQITKIRKIDLSSLQQALMASEELDSDEAFKIASIANGNLRSAKSLLHKGAGDNVQLFREWLSYVLSGTKKKVELYNWIETFGRLGREGQKNFFNYGLHFLREYLMMQVSGQKSRVLSAEELDFARRISKVLPVSSLETISNLLGQYYYYVERNANMKIQVMALSIKVEQLLMEQRAGDPVLHK